MRILAALMACVAVALAGCYASTRLLLDGDAPAHPLDDGVYQRAGGDDARLRITLRPDGWYDVEQVDANGVIGQTHRVLLNPLPLGALKAFAAAEETDDGFIYGVVLVQGERVFLATPDCADPLDASLAVDHGGQPDDDEDMTHNCRFRDPGALSSALTDYAGQADFGAPYTRK
jgi:hypothetical protein